MKEVKDYLKFHPAKFTITRGSSRAALITRPGPRWGVGFNECLWLLPAPAVFRAYVKSVEGGNGRLREGVYLLSYNRWERVDDAPAPRSLH